MNELPLSPDADLFRLAFDLAPSGMLAVGQDGSILLANREADRMFCCEPGSMLGQPVDRFVPAAARGGHEAMRTRFLGAPEARRMGAGRDLFALRCDGTEFPVEIGLNPVRLASGVIVIASVVDISERRAAELRVRESEDRARQAQKLESLGTLAGGIAHDFNNILLGIVGYTELAQRAAGDAPGVHGDLDQVLRAAERGRQLVRRILTFARQREAPLEPLAADRVVREAAELLRASLPATIEVRVVLEPNLPAVLAEETQVHQVVLNLGTNAAHAMARGGTLEVRLSRFEADTAFAAAHADLRAGPCVRLSVRDDGDGMTPEVRARLFEPFFTTKPVGSGSGLGMSVVLGIVQSLGGAIDVTSAPGQGTTVAIFMPAVVPPADAFAGAAGRPAEREGQRHVLFVDDEAALAFMETRQLQSLGYRVTTHTSSLEALADFRSRPEAFDLVVTDNTMPQMTGLVLARELTALRPGLPILMVSGYADHAEPGVLEAHGIAAVLGKPHTARELGAALSAILPRG